jgi:putative PIN family toxin of toxin-antitoxin system
LLVVLDSNVLISALISTGSPPDRIYRAWREKRFTLVTSKHQLAESQRASRYPKLRRLVPPREFGALIHRLHGALVVSKLPRVKASRDADDDYLLAMAQATDADFIVTGDAKGLLRLRRFGRTRILGPTSFLKVIKTQ